MTHHTTDIYYEVALTCRVIRVGSFKFINAPNSKVNEDLQSNLTLCSDSLSIVIGNKTPLELPASDISDIWTFTGRKLPKAFICMLLKSSSVCKIEKYLESEQLEFDPQSADLSKKYIVLFPSDESIQDFIEAQDSIPWIKGSKILSHGHAQELVLATAGQKKDISFSMETLLPHDTRQLLGHTPKTITREQQSRGENMLYVSPAAAIIINQREIKTISLQTKGKSILKGRKVEKRKEEQENNTKLKMSKHHIAADEADHLLTFENHVIFKHDLASCDFYSTEVTIEND